MMDPYSSSASDSPVAPPAEKGIRNVVSAAPRKSVSRYTPVLSRDLQAAVCRAGCALLGQRYPGASIEVRVPPFAAVQIGFERGPKHTRGTPPNVVEMSPAVFVDLAVGRIDWTQAQLDVSGVHAAEAAAAFPLT